MKTRASLVCAAAGAFASSGPGAVFHEESETSRALQLQATRLGPYATARRAQEVANYYIGQGYNARWFHNGDGYYVDVW
jgi:hypothetical protein